MKRKHCISDRIMTVDLLIDTKSIRLISVYLPHSGYELDDYYDVMASLSTLTMEGPDKGMLLIVAGDFTASLEDADGR